MDRASRNAESRMLKIIVQHLQLQHRMKADAIADQTGLAVTVVQSYMAEADNGRRPFPSLVDRDARIAAAASRRNEMGFRELPEPVEKEYHYSSAELPIGPPEE